LSLTFINNSEGKKVLLRGKSLIAVTKIRQQLGKDEMLIKIKTKTLNLEINVSKALITLLLLVFI
jgi:hypothetical protein